MTTLHSMTGVPEDLFNDWCNHVPGFWKRIDDLDLGLRIRQEALEAVKVYMIRDLAPAHRTDLAVQLAPIRLSMHGDEPYVLEGGRDELREVVQSLLANPRWSDIEAWSVERIDQIMWAPESGA